MSKQNRGKKKEIKKTVESKAAAPKEPSEIVKIVIGWSDSRVNGSFAAMVGVIFGSFGLLRLYPTKEYLPQFFNFVEILNSSPNWKLLTIGYALLGALGFYFYSRTVVYSTIANIEGGRYGTYQIFEELKNKIREGKSLDNRFQTFSLWTLRQRYFGFFISVGIFIISWFAVALRY
jgi:hypothetical protein